MSEVVVVIVTDMLPVGVSSPLFAFPLSCGWQRYQVGRGEHGDMGTQ